MSVSKHPVRHCGLFLSLPDYCDMLHLFFLICTPTSLFVLQHVNGLLLSVFCSIDFVLIYFVFYCRRFSYGLSCIWIPAPVSWKFLSLPKEKNKKTKVFVESFWLLITEKKLQKKIQAKKLWLWRLTGCAFQLSMWVEKNKSCCCSCIKTGVRGQRSTQTTVHSPSSTKAFGHTNHLQKRVNDLF